MHLSNIIIGWLCLLVISACTHRPSQGTVFGYRYNPNQSIVKPDQSPTSLAKPSRNTTNTARQPDVEIYTPADSAVRSRTLGENNEPQVVVLSVIDVAPPEAVAADKPGFVRSPHAPEAGLIDIRGYPPGTEVRDPYSGKPFLVPGVD